MTSSGQAWWGRGALQGGEERAGRAWSSGRGSLSRPHCPPPQKPGLPLPVPVLGRASPPVSCPLRSRNPPLAPRHLTWRHPTAHGLTFRALLPHQPPARTFRTESAEHAPRPRGCLGPDSWPQQGAEPGWGPLPHRLGRGSQGTQVTAMRRVLLEAGGRGLVRDRRSGLGAEEEPKGVAAGWLPGPPELGPEGQAERSD